ncbi:MAG: rhomboid family intramembrane serine protease [Verrucomicrobiota bacterium]|nr:rhomboid family intramembrane serine protease [Verrucomicrobiota bacterium]
MTEIDRALEEGSLALVGEFSSLRVANEYALVVLAMNLDCWLRMEAQGPCYALYAEAPFQVAIEEEFRLYTEEQSLPAERRLEIPLYGSGIELFLLWAMVLVFVFMNQTEAMVEDYCSSSLGLFERGEWSRPATSLFLHADVPHLVGNLLIGGIFCLFVAHTLGPLLGWIAILSSGALGNLATSWLHYPEAFKSLGASTATFGALGLLVGSSAWVAWHGRSMRRLGGAALPVLAGASLLGWFGAGGGDPASQVDVLAHVMGFGTGAVLGLGIVRVRGNVEAAG